MGVQMEIRGFSSDDATAVRELFIKVNRLLAPADLREAFEIYIARSLAEEIDKISDYYSERRGGFWVDPDFRRRGIARTMLDFAEEECRRRNRPRMNLSTSELQREALSFYQNAGY